MGQDKNNYLNYVPKISQKITWDTNQMGIITLHVKNEGLYNRVAQIFFKRPKISHIELDIYGSYLWTQMKEKKTVGELAERMKERFEDMAEPLYDRLVRYLQILHNNRFIILQKKDKIKTVI